MMRARIPWEPTHSTRYTIDEWEIEGRATALLLLDLQVANIDPERGAGPGLRRRFPRLADYYYRRLESVLSAVLQLQGFFRQHELPVVYCHTGLASATGRELADWSWRGIQTRETPTPIPCLLPPGDPDGGPWPKLAPRSDELVLLKQTLSPFNGTALDQYLRNMGVENLVLAGVLSNVAVEGAARNAGDRGFNTIVVEDACAALSPEDHEAAIRFTSWYVVKSTEEVLVQLGSLIQQVADIPE